MTDIPAFKKALSAEADVRLIKFASSLIPDLKYPMLGVRIPVLRNMAKKIARQEDWREVCTELSRCQTYEERMLAGLIPGYRPLKADELLPVLREMLVPLIDNWAICDCCCSTYVAVRRHREEVFDFLLHYARSSAVYEQRFAAVMLMDHFLIPEYFRQVLDVLTSIRPSGYYAEMGVAWALSVCFVKNPDTTYPIIQSGKIPATVKRMTLRKILESRRTPDSWRTVVRHDLRTA